MDGSSSPLSPITLVLILCLPSRVKLPSHILFSILLYSGSSLERFFLSKIMMALILLSRSLLDLLENKRSDSFDQIGSSWWKSPAKMIEYPPNDLVLFPTCMSCLLSFLKILLLMNDTSSITRILTSFHSFMSSLLICIRRLRKAALEIVTPPVNDAADPVYAVNKNVVSLHMTPTAKQNS
jgi:hypothetical protein